MKTYMRPLLDREGHHQAQDLQPGALIPFGVHGTEEILYANDPEHTCKVLNQYLSDEKHINHVDTLYPESQIDDTHNANH